MTNDVKSDYYSLSRPEVQKLVRSESKKILDIGCAAGKMASELKERNSAEVWGIEIVREVAQKAQEKLDKVLIGTVEEQIPKLPNKYFDSIIFADVLEHLVHPNEVLKEIKPKLKDDGEIIISLPNVRHWSVIISLLNGSFDYADFGILDRTHLRFFTLETAKNLLVNSGYEIQILEASIPGRYEIPKSLLAELKKIGLNVDDLQEKSMHFQYLFNVTKKEKILNIEEVFEKATKAINEEHFKEADSYLEECLRLFDDFSSNNINKNQIIELREKISKMLLIKSS